MCSCALQRPTSERGVTRPPVRVHARGTSSLVARSACRSCFESLPSLRSLLSSYGAPRRLRSIPLDGVSGRRGSVEGRVASSSGERDPLEQKGAAKHQYRRRQCSPDQADDPKRSCSPRSPPQAHSRTAPVPLQFELSSTSPSTSTSTSPAPSRRWTCPV
jgi:hypothetical protein